MSKLRGLHQTAQMHVNDMLASRKRGDAPTELVHCECAWMCASRAVSLSRSARSSEGTPTQREMHLAKLVHELAMHRQRLQDVIRQLLAERDANATGDAGDAAATVQSEHVEEAEPDHAYAGAACASDDGEGLEEL